METGMQNTKVSPGQGGSGAEGRVVRRGETRERSVPGLNLGVHRKLNQIAL